MRKQLLVLCAGLLVLTSTVFAVGPDLDEPDGWSWREGFFGDGHPDRDVFSNDPDVPGYLCEDCRDVYSHPMDFAAMAYNGYFGEDPWMWESELGIPFRIYNLEGQWVAVWFEDIVFDGITFLPDTLEVRLRLPNGQILTFHLLQEGPDLPIGDPDPEPPATSGECGCSGYDSGGEGEDDYTDPDDGLPEPDEMPEPSGVVSIVDPDEDDEFPEWEL